MPSYISRAKNLASRKLEDETIIMSVRSSKLYTLNESATRIWEAADGQTSIDAIARDVICEEYDVDYDTAIHDTAELIQKLSNDGLLVIHERPVTSASEEIA